MEHEKDRILEDTRDEFENELKPIQKQYSVNQIEIEDAKDILRRLKLKFQALKEGVARDAKAVESHITDEMSLLQIERVNELGTYIDEVERKNDFLHSEVESVENLYLSKKGKLDSDTQKLNEMIHEMGMINIEHARILEVQKKEVQFLKSKKSDKEEELKARISFIDTEKENINLRLDQLEDQFAELQTEQEQKTGSFFDHL